MLSTAPDEDPPARAAKSRPGRAGRVWGHTLSLPVARRDGGAVDIALRSSVIRFEPGSAPIDPRYHFAINIPRGAINEAASWIAERQELLQFHADADEAEGATIVHTDRGAAALYFIDGGGNVAELISPAEGERGDGRSFGAHCLLEVAEIEVATADVKRTGQAVLDAFGAAVHWGGGPGSMLTAIGDDHGVRARPRLGGPVTVMSLVCVPMSLRSSRVFASAAAVGLVVLVVMVVSSASSSGAIARAGGDRASLTRCVKMLLGIGGGSATPAAGSADATLVSSLAVFRRARSAVDMLPAAAHLREELAAAGATTYDPSAAVLLTRTGSHAAIYGVPATISLPVLPAGCGTLPGFADVGAYLASRADESGSGPGACMVATQLVQSEPSGSSLPGEATLKPTRTLTAAGAVCKSVAVMSGYVGTLGDERLGSARELALIPDDVTAITYALADGRRLAAPVVGNVVTPPAALSIPPTAHPLNATEFGQQLAAHLPVTVAETGPGADLIASLTRPDSLIADSVGSFSFLRGLLAPSSISGSSSSASSSGASCSARTHRCVAVTVTTTCNSYERCQTRRTIHRYRYVTAKPPPGTTGSDTQPTAPIVGRVNRLITRPTKLTLVLGGAPHHQVVVLLSVSCFSRNSAASAGGPPLHVTVPSRTPIAVPGPAHAFHTCDVGALVISSKHGPVRVTVVNG